MHDISRSNSIKFLNLLLAIITAVTAHKHRLFIRHKTHFQELSPQKHLQICDIGMN